MRAIQGFVTLNTFISNQPKAVSEFFELSPIAMTYSRVRGEYQSADAPGYILHTFQAVDEATRLPYALAELEVLGILNIVKAVQTYMVSATYPYDLAELQNTIQAQFSQSIRGFVPGSLHTGVTTTLPESLSWTTTDALSTSIKVWLRNEAFENQYTNFEIVTVPPIDLLDRFFGTYGDLAAQLSAVTISDTLERIETFKGVDPDTYLRVQTFNFINRSNPTQKTPVSWGVIIYGKNGDNVDSIKDAIVAYVLANSSHSQAEWENIFPDLFKRTEFLFFPRWDQIAIPNLTAIAALYKSALNPLECIAFAKAKWPSVSPSFVEANLTVIPFDYKAISVLALNGVTNLDGKKALMDLFPDYIPVSTNVLDFNRMSIYTRNWVLLMVGLINFAETANEFTTIVAPYRRVIRENVIYISCMYDSVNYLVATRSNLY